MSEPINPERVKPLKVTWREFRKTLYSFGKILIWIGIAQVFLAFFILSYGVVISSVIILAIGVTLRALGIRGTPRSKTVLTTSDTHLQEVIKIRCRHCKHLNDEKAVVCENCQGEL